MKPENIFESIPEKFKDELFEQLISKDGFRIERIVSKGHTSPESGWYDQKQDEWVILLKGKAVLSFENQNDVSLKQGDYINIPAHKKHRVSWTAPDVETIWLAVHYSFERHDTSDAI